MCFLKDAFSVNDRTKTVHVNNNNPVHSCSTYSSSQLPPSYGVVHYPPPYSDIGPMPFPGNSQLPFYSNSSLSLPSYHRFNNQQEHDLSCANQNHNQNQSRSTINLEFNPSIEVNPNIDFAPVSYNAAQSSSKANNINAIRNLNDVRRADNNFTDIRLLNDNCQFKDNRRWNDSRHFNDNRRFNSTDIRNRQNINNIRNILQQQQNNLLWPQLTPRQRLLVGSCLPETMNRAVGNFAGRLAGFGPYMQQQDQDQDRRRRRLLNLARCVDPAYDYEYWYPDYEGMTQAQSHPQAHPQNYPQHQPQRRPQTYPQDQSRSRFQDPDPEFNIDTNSSPPSDYLPNMNQSFGRSQPFRSFGRRRGGMPMYNPWEVESDDEDDFSDYEDEEPGISPWSQWGMGRGRGGQMGMGETGRQNWWGLSQSPWGSSGQMGWGGQFGHGGPGGMGGMGGMGGNMQGIRARNRRWGGGLAMNGVGGGGGNEWFI